MFGGGLVAKSCLTLNTPWIVACQAPLSMGFSRQEYWSRLPFPSPEIPLICIDIWYLFFSFFLHFVWQFLGLFNLCKWHIPLYGWGIFYFSLHFWNLNCINGLPYWLSGNTPTNAGDIGLIPVLGKSPGEGKGNLLQYSCLENSMGRGAWLAIVHGIAKSWTRLSSWTTTNCVNT